MLIDKSAAPGSTDSTTHTGLTPLTRYFYSAFAHNSLPAYAPAVSVSVLTLSTLDFDQDGDIDQSDFAFMQRCFSGDAMPYAAGCGPADADGDGDVDTADLNLLLPCMSGAHQPPGC